jgi:hypothetical protein
MHHDGVAFARVREQGLQLRPVSVFSRCLIGEYFVSVQVFELAVSILIDAADPDVCDALTFSC